MNPRIYYTYAFLREDKTPYYVGKGKGKRAWANRRKPPHRPKDDSRILILKEGLSEEEAINHEIYMIAVFGRKDRGTGILHNRTNGGEGVSGYRHTGETKKTLKIKSSGANNPRWKGGPRPKSRYRRGGEFAELRSANAKKAAEARTKEGLARGGSAAIAKRIAEDPDYQRRCGQKGGIKGGARVKELGLGICGIPTEERRERGKQVASQKWEDPDHPELGILAAGPLTLKQKTRGLPHGKENRRRVG